MGAREALTIGLPALASCTLLAYFLEIGAIIPVVDGVEGILLDILAGFTVPAWMNVLPQISFIATLAHSVPWLIELIGIATLILSAIHKERTSIPTEDDLYGQ